MNHHLGNHRGALHHRAVRCQISLQNGQSPGGAVGVVRGTNYLGIAVYRPRNVFSYGLSRHRHAFPADQPHIHQLLHHGVHAAGLVQILHIGGTRRGQMAEIGRFFTDGIGKADIEVKADLMSDGRQVQHGVSGTAQRHIHGQSVHDGILRDDIPGPDISPEKLHDSHSRMLRQLDPLRINRRDGAVSPKPHTKRLGEAVHGIGRIHSGAGAAGGADLVLKLRHILLRHGAGRVGTHRLKHGGQASLLPPHMSCQHGPPGHKHGGKVQPCRRHQKPRHILVTVGNHHQSIKLMGDGHALRGVCDQVSCHQGIFHPHMTHGNSVTDCDGGKNHRHAAGLSHPQLHCVHNLIQVHMSGHDLVVGAHDTNHGLFHLLGRKSQRVKQASRRSLLHSCSCIITCHSFYLSAPLYFIKRFCPPAGFPSPSSPPEYSPQT